MKRLSSITVLLLPLNLVAAEITSISVTLET
jgi:hypothetical protein